MLTYESMRRLEPHFFIHSGDTIYADSPIASDIRLPDGTIWRNITTEAKSKVAETLEEFRGNYLYNLLDDNVRRFNSETAQVWQWDDHEVVNNWSPGKDLSTDQRYRIKDIGVLARNAQQAFLEYAPMRFSNRERRVYRKLSHGPLLDIFVIDLRSYRAANSHNQQQTRSAATTYFGDAQLRWLLEGLTSSRAVWKIVASDMPIGLVVGDGSDSEGRPRFENSSNGGGPARGRELEVAYLLNSMKRDNVRNAIWLTADVHYAAAHCYNPERAQFSNFDPFWEFVAGPLHAGTLDPKPIDDTFGIEVVFQRHPVGEAPDRSPRAGLQFFGEVIIDGRTADLTVNLRDRQGSVVFTKSLAAHP